MKKILLSALVCAMLFTSLAGCTGGVNSVSSAASMPSGASSEAPESSEKETGESSIESSSPEESVVESESSADSSDASDMESQTSSGGFGVPDDSDSDDTGYVSVPGTSVGSSDFQTEFDKNPIDETYNEDMQNAASQSKVQEIITIAQNSWENAVSTAYEEALTACTNDSDKTVLRTEQEEWASTLEDELQKLRDAAADGLTGEYQVMMYYRTRTAELLNIVYENTGAFNQPDGEARGAG